MDFRSSKVIGLRLESAIGLAESVVGMAGTGRQKAPVYDMLSLNPREPPPSKDSESVRQFTVVVEKDFETGLFVGYVPGFPGAHSQGSSPDELRENLREVIAMLLEDGLPELEAAFAGIRTITA